MALARREGPHQRLDRLRLPVEHQAERMVGEQASRAAPVARRLRVPDSVYNLAMRLQYLQDNPDEHFSRSKFVAQPARGYLKKRIGQ